ncbi:ImmA/IrrE family metallo-endopeptidase [Robertmurraya sp. FSL W8-0741]|uniref:ImmA/IrrE family metallo-endopeptidase n=1 Tax=Robertmurraya sp. FSL W8-0741 TaxID=2954629 RepID=UPI0030FBD72C
MMTMMTFKPNYSKAERAAHTLLQINNVRELPVKVKKLSKHFPNLRIKKYTWFAKNQGMTLQEVCEFANSDEGCCYYKKTTGQYLILYNDQVENKGRIRWTIAHELGHFMLKHNEISNRATLGRSSLSDSEYEIFEKEANCFARELLAPPTVIIKLGKVEIFDIQNICEMSEEAASNVISFLNTGQRMGYGYTFNSTLEKMFSNFIYKMKNNHYCGDCRSYFIFTDPSFCPICRNQKITKTFYTYRGINNVKYNGYDVDANGRALACPQCGNEELNYNGAHCKICGVNVVNKCTNVEEWNGEIQWECGTILDGNARYCPNCGSKSTFFEQKLLENWEIEKEKDLIPF